MTLEQYFHLIINQPPKKEQTMMLKLSMFFTEQFEKLNSLLNKPVSFVQEDDEEDVDYWGFEMHTGQWVDENGTTVKPIHSIVVEPHNTTWMEVLDRILDEMEKHYGYNIKNQVYYSVTFPVNELGFDNEPLPGYGRCLNDEVLQQLLLAFPEVYHWKANGDVFK